MAKNDDKTQEPAKADAAAKTKVEAGEQAEKEAEAAQAKADPKKPKAVKEAESTEGLVKMHKDGTHLHVHPTTVKAHESAGWKVA
jgi:hypothetical protein